MAAWPAPGGVDIVLDSVGGRVLARSLDLLAPSGRAVVYGAAGGGQPTSR
nr:zinc-binding dehydrogenase [Streptosporangium subroseum]